MLLQIVLLLTFFNFGDAWSDYNDTRQRLCPQEASVGLSNDARNASGFFTESGEFFPTHATRMIDGARRGCICDLKPCLAICPPEGADTGLRHKIDDFVNYAAIPRVHTMNRSIDDVADARGPEEWFRFFVWHPCPGAFRSFLLLPAEDERDEYYLLGDGSLFLTEENLTRVEFLNFGQYCLHLKSDNLSYIPRVCSTLDHVMSVDPDLKKIPLIGGLVAVPFIIATVIVYSVLPELKNIHGAALRCYLCCLAVTNVAAAADSWSGPDFNAGPWCMFRGKRQSPRILLTRQLLWDRYTLIISTRMEFYD